MNYNMFTCYILTKKHDGHLIKCHMYKMPMMVMLVDDVYVQFLEYGANTLSIVTRTYTWLRKNKKNAVRRVLGDVRNDVLENFQIML